MPAMTWYPTGVLLLGALVVEVGLTPARGQDREVSTSIRAEAEPRATASEVRDAARMFDTATLRQARGILERAERATRVPVLIETIDTIPGRSIDEAATRRAHQAGSRGVFVLIAKDIHKISDPILPDSLADRLPESRRKAIVKTFTDAFHRGDFDDGLIRGSEAIARALSDAVPAAGGAKAAAEAGDGALVLRNQVRLTLAGARTVLAGAEAKAAQMGLKVNIAVVDDGGHLITFVRMDGARPASGPTAITKATTAATFRQATGPLPAGAKEPDPLLNISLQNAASASGGKITTLFGGVPIVVDNQVIGAVGVGGGTGAQDAEVARAGVAAFEAALK